MSEGSEGPENVSPSPSPSLTSPQGPHLRWGVTVLMGLGEAQPWQQM